MERSLFEEEHDMFRKAFRTFLDRELVPHREEWESAGVIDREVFSKAGAAGFWQCRFPSSSAGQESRTFVTT